MTPAVKHVPALLRAPLLVLLVVAGLLVPTAPARAYVDDYPWAGSAGTSADAFGFTQRQCVSYAAYRLYKMGHRINNRTYYNGTYYYWGSAYHWDTTAAALHKTITHTPKVGAVAQWNAYERSPVYFSSGVGYFTAGSYGHVAWVAGVYSDGTVLVRQYNATGTKSFSQWRTKAPRYLYV
jgi:surface antigen